MKAVFKSAVHIILINDNKIGHIKIGRKIYIPKFQIIQYLKIESNVWKYKIRICTFDFI